MATKFHRQYKGHTIELGHTVVTLGGRRQQTYYVQTYRGAHVFSTLAKAKAFIDGEMPHLARTRVGQLNRSGTAGTLSVPGLTRADREKWAKAVWEEAHAADPYDTETIAERITGAKVWAWSRLTSKQLQALSSALYPIALASRG